MTGSALGAGGALPSSWTGDAAQPCPAGEVGRYCPQCLPSKETPTGVCCQPPSSHPFAQSHGAAGLGPSAACPARQPLLPAPPCPKARGSACSPRWGAHSLPWGRAPGKASVREVAGVELGGPSPDWGDSKAGLPPGPCWSPEVGAMQDSRGSGQREGLGPSRCDRRVQFPPCGLPRHPFLCVGLSLSPPLPSPREASLILPLSRALLCAGGRGARA